MTIFDTGEKEPGLCDKVAQDFKDELLNLWQEAAGTGKEMTLAFAYKDGQGHISSIWQGDDESVDTMTQMQAMAELPDDYDVIGVVHTHPAADGYMNTILSPGDLGVHMRNADKVKNYRASYAITHEDGDIILFGLESDADQRGFGDALDELASYRRSMDAMIDSGVSKLQMITEMHKVAEEVARPCTAIVRKGGI